MIPGAGTPGRSVIGQISDGVSGQAAGATLATTVSLIAAVATGNATAEGAILDAAFSLLPGAASGDAIAAGATIAITAALMPGVATGESKVRRMRGGANTVRARGKRATARGALLVVEATLIPGIATGDPRPMTEEEAIAYDNEFLLLLA